MEAFMIYTLTFTTRERYKKALAAILRNPSYNLTAYGRDYSPNVLYPWSTLFYVSFYKEV